ncbi:MAG: hypothetical protein V3V89_00380 [Gammaproteobacteria bacterium]
MLKQFILSFILLFSWQYALADIESELEVIDSDHRDPKLCAKETVLGMVEGRTDDEILAMVDEIAQALEKDCLCDEYAVHAMLDVGIPTGLALDSVAKACDLTGPQFADIARSLVPGMYGGGPGGEVSP